MQCYKPVEMQNLEAIQRQAWELVPKDKIYTHLFHIESAVKKFLSIPELKLELEKLQFLEMVRDVALIVVSPRDNVRIHYDHGPTIYSLNIPIRGCLNTTLKFYTSTAEPERRNTHEGRGYWQYDPATCTEIDSLEMSSPHIINVKIPHSITNPNDEPRINLLLRLSPEVGKLF